MREDFIVYLMGYTYGSTYIGVSMDPKFTVAEYNKKPNRRQPGVLLATTNKMTITDAMHIQLQLKSYSNKQIREFFDI